MAEHNGQKQPRRDDWIGWDHHWMEHAKQAAKPSKDPSTRVGCVIVNQKNRIVATGYNGFPQRIHDTTDRWQNRPVKYQYVIHAEENAMANAVADLEGCTAYMTMAPCHNCMKMMIQRGIIRIVCPPPDTLRWDDSHKLAREMAAEAGLSWMEHFEGVPF